MPVLNTSPRLFFWRTPSSELVVDSAALSDYLGYAQNSIRKQINESWGVSQSTSSNDLIQGEDFIEGNSVMYRLYESDFTESMGETLTPVPASRGYLFVTLSGIRKIAERTTKKHAMASLLAHIESDLDLLRKPSKPVSAEGSPQKTSSEQPAEQDISPIRNYHTYKTLQTLLGQLRELSDPPLRELAIRSAELYTGMNLDYLRHSSSVSTDSPSVEKADSQSASPEGPITKPGFYSFTLMGQYAGNYSGRSAGAAANIVAKHMGLTPQQIRNTKLPFNEIGVFTDSRGLEHPTVRFDRDFSNRVIHELTTNPAFRPAHLDSFTFTPKNRQYPKLSEPVDIEIHADDFSLDDLVDALRK